MYNLIFHLSNFIRFIYNPQNPNYLDGLKIKKTSQVILYYLPMSIFGSFTLWYLALFGVNLGFYNEIVEKHTDRSIYEMLLTGTLIAPLLEEVIFRYPLSFFRHEKSFRWYYYIFSLIFGLVHIINYEFSVVQYYFAILIISPQIFSGLLFGYIRIIYGFWYGVLLHSVSNLIAITILY